MKKNSSKAQGSDLHPIDEIAKRAADLSPPKRALLELRLKKEAVSLDGIRQRFAQLSPAKQTLLELRLRKMAETRLSPAEISQRVAHLSPPKRALLALKLKQKDTDGAERKDQPVPADMAQRITNLSPAKRALLELRLKKKSAASGTPPQRHFTLHDVRKRIANLSPAKQELLKLRLRQKLAPLPDSPKPPPIERDLVEPPEPEQPLAAPAFPLPPTEPQIEPEPEPDMPGWLADIVEDAEVPPPPTAQPEADTAQIQADVQETTEPPSVSESIAEIGKTAQPARAEPGLTEDVLDFEEEPEAPEWLADIADKIELPATTSFPPPPKQPGPTELESDTDIPTVDEDEEEAAPAAEPPPAKSRWLESLRPSPEAVPEEEEEVRTAEATGMLAGVSTLLPAEKVAIPKLDTDSLNEAAQDFYAIATEAPQPATLPAPLTRREKLVGGAIRAALYLLLVIIIALPLIPALQNVENSQVLPWTEPTTGNAGDVLDSQRRQLISEQLGIIDLQQPGASALVSFDYSTATQGEMQPLAEAVINRLMGQGMRIIAVSLEADGAAIAQQTLEKLAAARGDAYGEQVINLGYLPGQVAAVRDLVADSEALTAIPDFDKSLLLRDQPEWDDIRGLEQVSIVVTLADNPTTARWWIEQLELVPAPPNRERFLLAATSAAAEPFLHPYRESEQLDGLISGIGGAAAIEAGRNNFGPARQMVDSLAIATIILVILIAAGTIVGWMPTPPAEPPSEAQSEPRPAAAKTTQNDPSKQA